VLGYHYLFGDRTYDSCFGGQTCTSAAGCCEQQIAATVLTITANINVAPTQQLPAFVPQYVDSALSKEIKSDVFKALSAASIATVPEQLVTISALTYSTVVLRILAPDADALSVRNALDGGAASKWAPAAGAHYALVPPPSVSEGVLLVTPDEEHMTQLLCDVGLEQLGCGVLSAAGCATSPCQNGAACMEGIRSYNCDCSAAWAGQICDQSVVECGLECGPHGFCRAGASGEQCLCQLGYIWAGGSCVDANECDLSPCAGDGVDQPSHGVCTESNQPTKPDVPDVHVPVGQFLCACDSGWVGPRCMAPDENFWNSMWGKAFIAALICTRSANRPSRAWNVWH
jgi:hypothetical protein